MVWTHAQDQRGMVSKEDIKVKWKEQGEGENQTGDGRRE